MATVLEAEAFQSEEGKVNLVGDEESEDDSLGEGGFNNLEDPHASETAHKIQQFRVDLTERDVVRFLNFKHINLGKMIVGVW
jgi:hypothetical protein